MTEQVKEFKEQGGAATMDPSKLRRWITSRMMTRLSSAELQAKVHKQAEAQRVKSGQAHAVEYFHQIDDGYSHLAAQLLGQLQQRYEIDLRCHLVTESEPANLPEPELLLTLSCYDSELIAPHYDLDAPFPRDAAGKHMSPSAEAKHSACAVMASLDKQNFIEHAAAISAAMWRGDQQTLSELGRQLGTATANQVEQTIAEGNARRSDLKHYSGAMFYYGGEWYWGVDRLYHLEQRLAEFGLDKSPSQPPIAPRKAEVFGPLQDQGQLTLEIFPSLRSPYTAIVFDRTVALAEKTGVKLKLSPVLPMVMRGVPATMEKGKYILMDTGREARAAGVPFGPCYDPIGEPTRRAYSLYRWAVEQGKAREFISTFIRLAWTERVNTNNDKGLEQVVTEAGLDWSQAKGIVGNTDWKALIESNRLSMYELGLWGVPSFRLLDETGDTVMSVWGQDRLWLIAAEIQKQLKKQHQ